MIRSALFGLMSVLIACALFLVVKVFGPFVERAIYPPIPHLVIDAVDCSESRVSGVVDKAAYFGGQAARIIELNVYAHEPYELLLALGEAELDNRSAGLQRFSVPLDRGCSEVVLIKVKHISPITGLIIPSAFGPFDHRAE